MIPSLPMNGHWQSCFRLLIGSRPWVRIHPLILRTLQPQSSRATNRALICTGLFIVARAKKHHPTPSCSHIVSVTGVPKSP